MYRYSNFWGAKQQFLERENLMKIMPVKELMEYSEQDRMEYLLMKIAEQDKKLRKLKKQLKKSLENSEQNRNQALEESSREPDKMKS